MDDFEDSSSSLTGPRVPHPNPDFTDSPVDTEEAQPQVVAALDASQPQVPSKPSAIAAAYDHCTVSGSALAHFGHAYYTIQSSYPDMVPSKQPKRAPRNPTNLDSFALTKNFVAREDELKSLESYFFPAATTSKGRRIFVLHGMGGIGKTQLCLKFARTHLDRFKAILVVDAASRESFRQSLARWAESVFGTDKTWPSTQEAPESRDSSTMFVDAQISRLRDWLSEDENQNWLMILDNMDRDWRSGEDQLAFDFADWLPSPPCGNILISTRLGDLDFDGLCLKGVEDGQALEMLQTFAKRSIPDAKPLLRKLGGLPLALAQAGAYLGKHLSMTVSEYLDLWTRKWKTLMEHQSQTQLNKYGSVLATWTLSFERVAAHNPSAAGLANLWAFLDRRDIFFELISAARDCEYISDMPAWYRELTDNNYWFYDSVKVLIDYSLVLVSTDGKSFYMHPVLHKWNRDRILRTNNKDDLYHLALATVASSVPAEGARDDWLIERRLLPHAVALQVGSTAAVHGQSGARSLAKVAELLWRCSSPGGSQQLFERALEIHRKIHGAYDGWKVDHQDFLAAMYSQQGNRAEAEELYRRAIRSLISCVGPDDPQTLAVLHNLALLYAKASFYIKAERLYSMVLAKQERILGAEDVSTIKTMSNFADLLRTQGRLSQARELSLRSVCAMKKKPMEEGQMLDVLHVQALIDGDSDALDRCTELLQQVSKISQRTKGPDHPETLKLIIELALVYRKQRDSAISEKCLQEAFSRAQRAMGPHHQATLDATWWLSTILHDEGRLDEAKHMAKHCATSYQTNLGGSHRETVLAWQWLQKLQDDIDGVNTIRVFCDRCSALIPNDSPRLHCTICYGGAYDVCQDCEATGRRCLRSHHRPVKAMFDGKKLIDAVTGRLLRDYRMDHCTNDPDPHAAGKPEEQTLPQDFLDVIEGKQ